MSTSGVENKAPGRPKVTEPKPDETPRQKFVRLAELRTSNALASLDKLTTLANKAWYDYEQDDVDKIMDAITQKVTAVERSFKSGRAGEAFTL